MRTALPCKPRKRVQRQNLPYRDFGFLTPRILIPTNGLVLLQVKWVFLRWWFSMSHQGYQCIETEIPCSQSTSSFWLNRKDSKRLMIGFQRCQIPGTKQPSFCKWVIHPSLVWFRQYSSDLILVLLGTTSPQQQVLILLPYLSSFLFRIVSSLTSLWGEHMSKSKPCLPRSSHTRQVIFRALSSTLLHVWEAQTRIASVH